MKRTKKEILSRRLQTTAVAAGAALAGAGAADAAVIGHTISETVGPNESFDLDLDGDGIFDYEFTGSTSFTSTTGFGSTSTAYASVQGQNGNGVFITSSFGSYARAFTASESVGLRGDSISTTARLTSSFAGEFAGPDLRYLGLQFNTTDYGVVNGWARVAVPKGGQIFIESYAFETDGSPIHVPNEIPEPSTLLLMASGCAGLIALRRRRKS